MRVSCKLVWLLCSWRLLRLLLKLEAWVGAGNPNNGTLMLELLRLLVLLLLRFREVGDGERELGGNLLTRRGLGDWWCCEADGKGDHWWPWGPFLDLLLVFNVFLSCISSVTSLYQKKFFTTLCHCLSKHKEIVLVWTSETFYTYS